MVELLTKRSYSFPLGRFGVSFGRQNANIRHSPKQFHEENGIFFRKLNFNYHSR